jgi:glycosyltransferase involved in cell wall biosynthesis
VTREAMRVLIVTQYFWPENSRINDVALGLRERGHEVTVYTGKPNYPDGHFFPGYGAFSRSRETFQGIPILRVPLVPRGAGGSVRLALNFLSFALTASLAAPFRCRGGFDAILVYEPSPITVALPAIVLRSLKRAPLLLWVQDLWPESLSATGAVRSPAVLKAVERVVCSIYRQCACILVQSRAFIEPIARLGINPERVAYLPNSAEALYGLPISAAQRAAAPTLPTGFRVMFAGNIGAAQDFGTILGAAERLKSHGDVQWMIVGDGRMLPWVTAEVARRGLQNAVHLLGRYPVEAMPAFFAQADVMLVTLKRDPIFAMTIPTKLQSYLAAARPVVAALEGEGARIVGESGAGLACPSEDPAALAEAVLAMRQLTPPERAAMAQRARAYFEAHFEREALLTRLEECLRDAVAGNSACGR